MYRGKKICCKTTNIRGRNDWMVWCDMLSGTVSNRSQDAVNMYYIINKYIYLYFLIKIPIS